MDYSNERWRIVPVLPYAHHYEVSDMGRIRSVDRLITRSDGRQRRYRGRLLTPSMGGNGRMTVVLSYEGKPKTFLLHRLVALAHLPPAPRHHEEVTHLNGDIRDCRAANLQWQLMPDRHRRRATHGLTHAPEYRAYHNMLARCYNRKDTMYRRYGGRGITVCDNWRESFEHFYADMGPRPSAVHSLDRIDNNGPYSPDNCRWATPTEQQRNKADTVYLSYRGRTLPVSEWAELTGLDPTLIHSRINAGWYPGEVLETPYRHRRKSL